MVESHRFLIQLLENHYKIDYEKKLKDEKMNTKNEIIDELVELVKKSQNNNMLTIGDVSNRSTLSFSTIRRAVKKGELKKCNRPGKLLFRPSDIDKWLGY